MIKIIYSPQKILWKVREALYIKMQSGTQVLRQRTTNLFAASIITLMFLFYFTGCSSTHNDWGKKETNFNASSISEQEKFKRYNFKEMHYVRGTASYYASSFKGKKTASGERYDPKLLTAASRTLPMNTRVIVQSTQTGEFVIVRINDRGPHKKTRVIDLSEAAAKKIGLFKKGVAQVDIYLIE